MAQISLRLDLNWGDTKPLNVGILPVSKLSSSSDENWMENFLEIREKLSEDQRHKESLHALAIKETMSLYGRLCLRLTKDIEIFNQHRGWKISTERISSSLFRVYKGSYPVIALELNCTPDYNVIRFEGYTKESSSAQENPVKGDICIVAKGHDELYFRLDGNDYTSETTISKMLLTPLLEAVS